MVRQPKKKPETEKGPLYHEYDSMVHQYISHLRRVHGSLMNKPLLMEVKGFEGKVPVKTDALAVRGMPLYYYHSKTKMYNDQFFHFWDNVMVKSFAIVAPWFTVDSKKALDALFALHFEKYVAPPIPAIFVLHL